MARRVVWRSALAALAAVALAACSETLDAPGECPELCPSSDVQLVDTVLTGLVTSDSSYRGYTEPRLTPLLVASDIDSMRSIVAIRFDARPDSFSVGDTIPGTIGTVDSVRLELRLAGRDTAAHNLRLMIYRLPALIDTLLTYATALPYFDDSLLIDSIAVADTTVLAQLALLVAPNLVEPDSADSGFVSIGIAVRADQPTSVTMAASNFTGTPPRLTYFVNAAPPHDTVKTTLSLTPTYDALLLETPPGPPTPGAMFIGNMPAARALLHFDVPRFLLDSTTIVRATLLLTPVRPVTGRPNEVLTIQASPILRDHGGKSIAFTDSLSSGIGAVMVGGTDTVQVEMGSVLRFWQVGGDSLPHVALLRAFAEDITMAELQAARATAGAAAPRLHVTFIRRFNFGVP